MRERVASARRGAILEAARKSIHRLHQHRFLVPVGPDQLDQARLGAHQRSLAEGQAARHLAAPAIVRKSRLYHVLDIGVVSQETARDRSKVAGSSALPPRFFLDKELLAAQHPGSVGAAM